MCILSTDQQGATPLFAKRSHSVSKPMKFFFSQLIYSLSKHCKLEFMVLISCFKSSSMQQDVHFVNDVLF